MLPTADLVGFGIVCFAIAASPGPATAFIIACRLRDGHRPALAGVAGSLLIGAACALGISAAPAAVAALFDAVRAIAPAVVLVMALRMGWPKAAPRARPAERRLRLAPGRLVEGMLINLLNPGQYAVFLFIVSGFLAPQEQTMFVCRFALGVLFTTVGAITYLAVAHMVGRLLPANGVPSNAHRWQRWGSAALLAGIAVVLLLAPPGPG